MANNVVFAHFMEEHGNLENEQDEGDQPPGTRRKLMDNKGAKLDEAGPKKAETRLMQIEERVTGAITWSVYHRYLRFAGSVAWAPFLIILLTISQIAQGMSIRILLNRRFLMLIFSWQ
jgi:ATP-binding cassette, subfamily C (CFTR/MRP), member 1